MLQQYHALCNKGQVHMKLHVILINIPETAKIVISSVAQESQKIKSSASTKKLIKVTT